MCSSKRIFINLSNHPSSKWSEKQLAQANLYGEIIDLPFPDVDADGSEEYITQLVKTTLSQIKELQKGTEQDSTIHIMGEMTFTYAMVNTLKAEGYKCVASTTKRNTIELEDGTKQSLFTFNKFREYR